MDRLAAMDAFIRVVDAGSFSDAGKQLRIGQPAISKTIAQLEDRLGVRLLLRSTHGLTPTEAGRSFYERAKSAIEEADGAEVAACGAAARLSGRGAAHGPASSFSGDCPQDRTVPKARDRHIRLFRGEGHATDSR